jgi:hypothetical protein
MHLLLPIHLQPMYVSIVVNISNNTIYMCTKNYSVWKLFKSNFMYANCGWSCICILTTVVELVSFFRSSTMSVLNSVINVDCVVRKILSLTSLFLVIFLKSIYWKFPFLQLLFHRRKKVCICVEQL